MANAQIFSNNTESLLTTAINTVDTTIIVNDGFDFPTLIGTDEYYLVTLDDGTNIEVLKVTVHATSSATMTVERAQEGLASSFGVGTNVSMRVTADYLTTRVVQANIIQAVHVGADATDLQQARQVDPTDSVQTAARGDRSVAIGDRCHVKATAADSVVIGSLAVSRGTSGIAIGEAATVTATSDVAIGDSPSVSGSNSVAIGTNTSCTKSNSVAIGNGATNSGYRTISIGLNAAAPYRNCISIGGYSSATYTSAIAVGYQVAATGYYSVAIGNTAASTNTDTIAIGNSANASSASGIAIGPASTASGPDSVSIGKDADAANGGSISIGRGSGVEGDYGVSVGHYSAVLSGAYYGMAIGYRTEVAAGTYNCTALGQSVKNNLSRTTVLANPIICGNPTINSATSANNRTQKLTGALSILTTEVRDFKTATNAELNIPTNFYIEEVGVISTEIAGLVTQPTVSFGTTSGGVDVLAATITTALTVANKRERFTSPLLDDTGITSLFCNVAVAAAGTTVSGRFYVKGFFVHTT